MNKNDTIAVMAVLSAAYPAFYKDRKAADLSAAVNLWQEMFEEESAEEVQQAVKALIACDTKGFPPVIGQVKEQIRKLRNTGTLGEQEAWALVRKQLGRIDRYHPRESFDALPDRIQRCIGSASTMLQWSQIDQQTLETVIASNFFRAWREESIRQQETEKLPSSVKRTLKEVQNRSAYIGEASSIDMKKLHEMLHRDNI